VFTVAVDSAPSGAALGISVSNDTLFASGTGPYQWILNGSRVPYATMQFMVPAGDGLYTVELGPAGGCQVISDAFNFTGISDLSSNEGYEVYPNPSAARWTLESYTPVRGNTCQIFDQQGRLVYSALIDSKIFIINASLSSGMYFLKILHAGQTSFNAKLVKL
jgi:hypothetical protein